MLMAVNVLQQMEADTILMQFRLIADIVWTAVLAASGMAGQIAGTVFNVTNGTTTPLNYSVPLYENTYYNPAFMPGVFRLAEGTNRQTDAGRYGTVLPRQLDRQRRLR